jgi:hypothetical protein
VRGRASFKLSRITLVVRPGEDEINGLLVEHRALTARYSTELDAPLARLSYYIVHEKPTYELSHLNPWARKNVRRRLRNCTVENIPLGFLASDGWALQKDTLNRQRRQLVVTQRDWRRWCESAASLPGFEAWGALVHGRLAASVITFLMGDCSYMLYPAVPPRLLERARE